jgi:tetratricopeptide (TPR) repeat protein
MLLISQATRSCEDKDWPLGESLATEAINHNITLHTAYMVRARARRFQGKFDEAIQDYTTVLELDPENSDALMLRGATFMDQSSRENDYRQTSAIIAKRAFCDFKRASAINPAMWASDCQWLKWACVLADIVKP